MGRRLPQFFFALSMLALVLLVAAVWQSSTPLWKTYQRKLFQLEAQEKPNAITKAAVLATPSEIHQFLLPGLQRVDRCTTCHLGVDDPTMKNAAVRPAPAPPRSFPLPTNLKVLPRDLTGAQVRNIMQQWEGALGIQCASRADRASCSIILI